MNAPAQILDRLPKPRVLTWISSPRFPVESIAAIAASGQRVIAFGPVLSLADVAVAQALLRAGAAVHLVLPCDKDVLLLSAPFAETTGSAEDLRSLLAQASGVTPVTGEGGPEEPAARLLCQQQACGLANLRAESLAVTSDGVAFGDAQPIPRDFAANPAGLDLSTHAIRTPCAILFGDVRGFSRLREPEQLDFLTHIIGGFADVLDSSAHKQYAETAGDGLYVVFSDIMAAVECCFRLRDVLRPERVTAAGLPSHLGIRLSAHIGPLFRRFDRVIGREKFCGMEVIRTARIEPVTPVGEIFVTEQFAASLAYAATGVFICEYVGLQPMAKGFGTCRMYSLRRAIQ
jgi:class 3 adenylate cyclase